jgi:hypothetical protein
MDSENPILARKLAQLEFKDRKNFLIELRLLEQQEGIAALPEKVRNLRTNELKPWREARSAAMFCYLMGQALGEPIYLAAVEDEDFDFVALQQIDDENHFKLCQLKELVPTNLNPQATLNQLLAGLSKYDNPNLTVVIHLNRREQINFSELKMPTNRLGGLWMFGALDVTQSTWGLWGNFLQPPINESVHPYPSA